MLVPGAASGLCVKTFGCDAEISALDVTDAGDQVSGGMVAVNCVRVAPS